MYKNIIIEGARCTGKSTFIRFIQNHTDKQYNVYHCTDKTGTKLEDYIKLLRRTEHIFDRHFLGEIVYPAVYNRYGNLTPSDIVILFDQVLRDNILIVLYSSSEELLYNRLINRDGDVRVTEEGIKIECNLSHKDFKNMFNANVLFYSIALSFKDHPNMFLIDVATAKMPDLGLSLLKQKGML